MSMKKLSEYDQEIPHSLTADKPTTPRGRATEHQKSQDIYGEVWALHRSYYVREHNKTAAFWIMYIDLVEIYLFNIPCTTNDSNFSLSVYVNCVELHSLQQVVLIMLNG